eukprot:GHUV01022052.1.p1 GENE.GHUV01022052.1~~GHUV01022052.1.p1  ORF type:complete len:131 (+),score=32.67 GHUV01022052.1:573-965(+)
MISSLIINAAELLLLLQRYFSIPCAMITTTIAAVAAAGLVSTDVIAALNVIHYSSQVVSHRFEPGCEMTQQLRGVDPPQAVDGVTLLVETDQAGCYIAQMVVSVDPTTSTTVRRNWIQWWFPGSGHPRSG